MPIERIKILIEYDGTKFCGWQYQDDAITVQGVLESALQKVFNTKERIVIEGSGRTDAGVHALAQAAHFDIPEPFQEMWINKINKLPLAINFYLFQTPGVVVISAENVPENFHARFSAITRSYRYIIYNRKIKSVINAERAWHVPEPLNISLMEKGGSFLIGFHDFNAFRSSHCQAKNSNRTISNLNISREEENIYIDISARSFLHNQVRIISGTLKQIGEGKYGPDHIKNILESRDRTKSGPTAPAHGLYFMKVEY